MLEPAEQCRSFAGSPAPHLLPPLHREPVRVAHAALDRVRPRARPSRLGPVGEVLPHRDAERPLVHLGREPGGAVRREDRACEAHGGVLPRRGRGYEERGPALEVDGALHGGRSANVDVGSYSTLAAGAEILTPSEPLRAADKCPAGGWRRRSSTMPRQKRGRSPSATSSAYKAAVIHVRRATVALSPAAALELTALASQAERGACPRFSFSLRERPRARHAAWRRLKGEGAATAADAADNDDADNTLKPTLTPTPTPKPPTPTP